VSKVSSSSTAAATLDLLDADGFIKFVLASASAIVGPATAAPPDLTPLDVAAEPAAGVVLSIFASLAHPPTINAKLREMMCLNIDAPPVMIASL
jgi:hypothetical protein